jgi:CelD/BcsL family acetyltransferase involved in cellulose biosynthesis
MQLHLHRYDQYGQFAERRQEWTAFADRCALSAPFCHPKVWLSWLAIFIEFDPIVYELRRGSELCALLPLYRQGSTLHLATDEHLDYQDIVAGSDSDAVSLLIGVIEEEGKKGLSLAFEKVAEHSRLRRALTSRSLAGVAAIRGRYWSICPTTTLDLQGPGRFLESLSSRQRKDFKAAARRIRETYPDYVIEQRFGNGIDAASLEQAASLHRENQYRKKGASVFADRDFAAYLELQSSMGASLLLSFLREKPGGPVLAFNLGYVSDDTYYYSITAYNGSNAALSPGRVLLIETLAHCADRVRGNQLRFDLLSGEESYKCRWATSFYEVARYQVIPRRLTNLPRVAAYSAVYSLKSAKNRLMRWRSGGERLPGLEHEPPVLTS